MWVIQLSTQFKLDLDAENEFNISINNQYFKHVWLEGTLFLSN